MQCIIAFYAGVAGLIILAAVNGTQHQKTKFSKGTLYIVHDLQKFKDDYHNL